MWYFALVSLIIICICDKPGLPWRRSQTDTSACVKVHCRDNNTRKRRKEIWGEGCYFHASLSPSEQDRGASLDLPKQDLWSQRSGTVKSLEQTAASPPGMQRRDSVRLALVTESHERLDSDSTLAPARPHWQCQTQAVLRILLSQCQCNHHLKNIMHAN